MGFLGMFSLSVSQKGGWDVKPDGSDRNLVNSSLTGQVLHSNTNSSVQKSVDRAPSTQVGPSKSLYS